MHNHSHVMDPFNPQVPVQMFDQMNEYLRRPPLPPKPSVTMEPISILQRLIGK